jgi:hypothetical protein
LSDIYWNKLASRNQLKKRARRVDKRGCVSNTLPKKVPLNYAVNREWYKAHKDLAKYRLLLSDWLRYPATDDWEHDNGTFADDEANDEADNEGEN